MTETATPQTYQEMRPYLFAVAYRMTGSASDAEDLVHDAWLRYIDAGSPGVDSLRAYLTRIISRLSLDHLKSARVQREQYLGPWMPEPIHTADALPGPAETAEEREQVSIAYLTLLERLSPDQRVVYVLREAFGLGYDEIAMHLGKPAATCRQIFHRARQRLDGAAVRLDPPDKARDTIEAFLAAFSTGDTETVTRLLASDVAWGSDAGPRRLAARRMIRGTDRVVRGLEGLARKWLSEGDFRFEFADVNGAPAIIGLYNGGLERVIAVDVAQGRIRALHVLLNPEKLQHLAGALGLTVAEITDERAIPRAARTGQATLVQV